ncbi:MAG: hypothetical protein ACSW8C_04145 [bacterium]
MNISSQGFANQYSRDLQVLQSNNLKYIECVSTGHQMQKPSDDPSSASALIRVQTHRMEISQCLRNSAYARSLTDISAQTIEKMMEVNTDIGAYSVQYSSLNRDALVGIRSTIDGLLEQMVDLLNTKQMDTYLFGGNKLSEKPFEVTRDPDTQRIVSVQYVGSTTNNTYAISPSIELNSLTDAAENQKMKTALDNLLALRNAFYQEPPDVEDIQALGQTVNQDNQTIFADILGNLGAKLTRIEHAEQQNQYINEDLEKISSQHADVDLADIMVKLQQSQCAYQAALQAGSKVLNLSLLNYL